MDFFHRHSSDKIYSLKLYHLLNFTLHSKANACNIGTFIKFYMQMQVEKTHKTFASRFYGPFTKQCIFTNLAKYFIKTDDFFCAKVKVQKLMSGSF